MIPVLGMHQNVRFADYLAWDIPSQSSLKSMGHSPAHYRATRDGERVMVPTDDMTLGSALHTVFLEPELILETVAHWEGGTRRGKEWQMFQEEHAGKYILTDNQYAKLAGMVGSMRKHPFVREWQSKIESVETSMVCDVHGLRMKMRCDALTPSPIVDIKKVASGDPRRFTNAVLDYGYHIQAAAYRRAFSRERYVLLTVESDPPYDVVPYELSPAFLRVGEQELTRLIGMVQACERTGNWPGRSESEVLLEPPEWAIPQTGVVFENQGENDGD